LLALLAMALGPASSGAALLVPPSFTVKASNGFSIFVLADPAREGRPASVVLFVLGKGSGAFYSVPATVTETSIDADLGLLGEIAVTFHPSGKARTAHSACGGDPIRFDSGYYEGTISFHGEEGFTAADTTRAPGDLGLLLNLVCPGSSGSIGGLFLPGAELDINSSESRSGTNLKVVKNRPTTRAHYEASVSEERKGMVIERFAGLIAKPGTFRYDPEVRTATVHPPAPFSGTGHYRRSGNPLNRWTGNLSVDLPGRSNVPLTGTGLRASLRHAHWEWHAEPEEG
jgi:hypothetical protein